MSVDEAVQLVLQAAAMSGGGEIFTLDMGKPVNILDLARKLIRMSGRVPDRDIEIVITGAKPGEKLVEDLIDVQEETLPSGHPSISVCSPPAPDPLNLRRALHELEALSLEGRREDLTAALMKLSRPAAMSAIEEHAS